MKKLIILISLIILGAIILGIIGLLTMINYGGNNCDQPPAGTCSCFCCNMFNSRGYEACSQFGFYVGLVIGGLIGFLVYRLIEKKYL